MLRTRSIRRSWRSRSGDATITDLNVDGLKDIVVANHSAQSLTVLLNQGSLAFAATEIALPHYANDVAAADVNGDGWPDLIVAASDSGLGGTTGDTYTGSWSKDGVTWSTVGSVSIPLNRIRLSAGLAVTSHSATAATASFDDVRFDDAHPFR
jgi:hypothetical protein